MDQQAGHKLQGGNFNLFGLKLESVVLRRHADEEAEKKLEGCLLASFSGKE